MIIGQEDGKTIQSEYLIRSANLTLTVYLHPSEKIERRPLNKMNSGMELASNGMEPSILIILVSAYPALSSPQYTGQTIDLSEQQQYTVDEIFGGMEEGYTGAEVLNEDGYVAPDDYHQSELNDQATAVVDNIFENCADYTASQGYECVPYYQCHNGTIITDGGGLIDIRNGFGILSPEDSKCPGFLDVCCQDADFVPPPPQPVQAYTPKCGQRHQNGLGARIQGFSESESQFGEWPHMCAVLAEEVVSQGYGENETLNMYV